MPNKIYTKNGIEYGFKPTFKKWEFKGTRANGESFTLLENANGIERANKIASAVAGSIKRVFAGAEHSLDAMARGTIKKILAS
jgi:hypothetical protein